MERKAVACDDFLLCLHVPSCPLWLSGFPMSAIFTSICLCSQPCTIESTDPTPPFSCFCCKQRRFPQSSLGPPLRDAWVTLGWPKGDPRPPNPRPNPKPSRQRVVKSSKTQNATVFPLRILQIVRWKSGNTIETSRLKSYPVYYNFSSGQIRPIKPFISRSFFPIFS